MWFFILSRSPYVILLPLPIHWMVLEKFIVDIIYAEKQMKFLFHLR